MARKTFCFFFTYVIDASIKELIGFNILNF